MEFNLDQRGDEAIFRLRGSVTGERWGGLRERVLTAASDEGVRIIQVDLSEVDDIDLEGVAFLLLAAAAGEEHGTPVRVTGATGQVRRKLDVTGASGALGLDPE